MPYKCYQTLAGSQLIKTTDYSGPKEVPLGGTSLLITPPYQGSGCRVAGLRVQGSGLMVSGFRVQGSGSMVSGCRCRVQGAGLMVSRFRAQGAGFPLGPPEDTHTAYLMITSSSGSLGSTDSSGVDMRGVRFKSVIFGAERGLDQPGWSAQTYGDRARTSRPASSQLSLIQP